MDLKEFGSKVANLAPALGGIFLGPAGAAGGTLLKVIANSFGLKEDAKPDEIYQAIQQDPNALVKLKELEFKHEDLIIRTTLEWKVKQLEYNLENTQGARAREVDVTKATGKKEINLYVLAWLTVIGFFLSFIIVGIINFPTNPVAISIISTLFGALIASYRDVHNYFFGSSKSSQDKTAIIANGMKKP